MKKQSYINKEFFAKIKNGFFYFGSSIIALMFSLFTFPIYSEYLSAEDFGLIGYFNSLQSFILPVFVLGMTNYYLMIFFKQNQKENSRSLFNILFYLSINNSIFFVLLLIVGFYSFEAFNVSYPFFPFSILILSQAFFAPYSMFLLQQYRIRKEGGRFFIFSAIAPILNAGFSILFLVGFNMGVVGRVGGLALSGIVMGIICLLFLRKFTLPNISFNDFKMSLKTVFPIVLASYACIPIETIDRIMLERLKMPNEFGLYSIGLQISGFFLVASTSLFKAFEPDIFNSVIKSEKVELSKNVVRYLTVVIIGFVLFMVILDPMISILTKGKFVGAVYYCTYLSMAKFISSLGLILGAIILAKQKMKASAYVIYVSSITSVIVYPILIKYWGFDGALIGRVVVPVIGIIISLFIIKRIGI